VVDLLVVMSVLAVAVFVLLSLPLRRTRCDASRIACVNNLKQVTMGYRLWSNDHGERFPWEVPRKEGGIQAEGIQPATGFGDLAEAFRCLSNELTVPKILVCPKDTTRVRASSFDAGDANRFGGPGEMNTTSNLTYFAGWDARDGAPLQPLAGDSDFAAALTLMPATAGAWAMVKSVGVTTPSATLPAEAGVGWESKLHATGGNLGLSDGSVQQLNSQQLQSTLARAAASTNTLRIRLVFPK
jgi:hypothetical protein